MADAASGEFTCSCYPGADFHTDYGSIHVEMFSSQKCIGTDLSVKFYLLSANTHACTHRERQRHRERGERQRQERQTQRDKERDTHIYTDREYKIHVQQKQRRTVI